MQRAQNVGGWNIQVGQVAEKGRVVGPAAGCGQLPDRHGRHRQPLTSGQSLKTPGNFVGHVPQVESAHVALC